MSGTRRTSLCVLLNVIPESHPSFMIQSQNAKKHFCAYETFSLANHVPYHGCEVVHYLMFPDSKAMPSHRCDLGRHALVAGAIAGKLTAPIRLIGFGGRSMHGTGVPETAVDEDGKLGSGEDNIRSTGQA